MCGLNSVLKHSTTCNRLLYVRPVHRRWNEYTRLPNVKQSRWNTTDIDKDENKEKLESEEFLSTCQTHIKTYEIWYRKPITNIFLNQCDIL
jgi:hypothetical protein